MIHSYITFLVSLLISLASAYCTVVGYGTIFTSAPIMTMVIASVIELGRVVLVFDIHHYWKPMPWLKKIPGLAMLIIAMSLSAIGVFGFFANAYSAKTQEITPLQIQIRQLEAEIPLYQNEIKINNDQIVTIQNSLNSESMETAMNKFLERDYITKALNIKKDAQKQIQELAKQNKEANNKITEIQKQISDLEIESEAKAPSIAHLKYFSKLFGVDNDTSIIIFIVMIMLVFDTLAMYLMITSDWIKTLLGVPEQTFPVKSVKKQQLIPIKNVKKEKEKNIIENEKEIVYNEPVKIEEEVVDNMKQEEKEIEVVEKKEPVKKSNIDIKVSKLVALLKENPGIINDKSFITSLSKTPLIVDKLEQELGKDNEIMVKLRAKLK